MIKKRIKLTDKELAIAMWVYIKLYIEGAELNTESLSVVQLKTHFLHAHGKNSNYWYNLCLLCQRYITEGYNTRCKCPLAEGGLCCSIGSSWWAVACYANSEEHKQRALKACDKIIKIMEAEKDE